MRLNRDVLAIVILIAVFVAGGLLLGGHSPQTSSRQVGADLPDDPSISNDRATGSKAIYAWVQSEGYQAQTWRLPWTHLAQAHASLLLVINPQTSSDNATLTGGSDDSDNDSTALAAGDAATLRQWIGKGHNAVLLTSDLSDGNNGPDPFAQALGIFVNPLSQASSRTEFAPQQPTDDTRGILSLHSDAPARISQKEPTGVSLFGDAAGPLVLTQTYGKGHLFVVADGGLWSNANLGRSENARFLANLLAHYAPSGTSILFDEYHHGDAALSMDGSLWAVLGWPLQLALLQLVFAGLIVIGVVAIRFGAPLPLRLGTARTSGEYVASVAALYQRAGASATALDTLYRGFLRDLCANLALAPDVGLEQLAETAARRGQTERQALRRLLAACEERLDAGKVTETDLLDIVRRMERVRKDMGIA
jgi:hypothetical protein